MYIFPHTMAERNIKSDWDLMQFLGDVGDVFVLFCFDFVAEMLVDWDSLFF